MNLRNLLGYWRDGFSLWMQLMIGSAIVTLPLYLLAFLLRLLVDSIDRQYRIPIAGIFGIAAIIYLPIALGWMTLKVAGNGSNGRIASAKTQ